MQKKIQNNKIIIDNFLPDNEAKPVLERYAGEHFPWYFKNYVVSESQIETESQKHQYQFTHHVLREDGSVVAQHQGAHFYTIGQRKGLHVGGRPKPSFAIGIDVENNIVFTGQGENHLGLYRKALKIEKGTINYLDESFTEKETEFERKFLVRIRYRQGLQEATLVFKDGEHYIIFKEKQRGITSGQFAAWYSGEILVGSGVIES